MNRVSTGNRSTSECFQMRPLHHLAKDEQIRKSTGLSLSLLLKNYNRPQSINASVKTANNRVSGGTCTEQTLL